MDATDTLVEVLRSEGLRVLATLARTVGDLAVAEDALSEATITALDKWPKTGSLIIRVPGWPWSPGARRLTCCDASQPGRPRRLPRSGGEPGPRRPDGGGDRGDGAGDVSARRHAAPDLHLLPPGAWP